MVLAILFDNDKSENKGEILLLFINVGGFYDDEEDVLVFFLDILWSFIC